MQNLVRLARRFLHDRSGDMFAWTAVVVAFLALPLSSLSIDIVRGMYVRTHLQTAADAACQAAADDLDVQAFRSIGVWQIKPGLARSQAAVVFAATLADAGKVKFTPSLSVGFLSPTIAYCQASAAVDRFLPLTPTMRAVVETTSEMRVVQQP